MAYAQNGDQRYVDSLRQIVKNESEEASIPALLELCYAYFSGKGNSKDSIEYFAGRALSLSRKYNRYKYEVQALQEFGYLYGSDRELERGLDYMEQALEVAKVNKDTELIYKAYGAKAFVYHFTEKFDSAAYNYQRAFKGLKASGVSHTNDLFKYLMGSAATYIEVGKLDRALLLLNENVDLANNKDVSMYYRAYYLNLLGIIKTKQENFNEAIGYLEKALVMAREMNDPSSTFGVLSSLGAAYNGLGKYKEALVYLEEGLPMTLFLGEQLIASETYFEMGIAYMKSDKPKKAIYHFQEAARISETLDEPIFQAMALKNISLIQKGILDELTSEDNFKETKNLVKKGIVKAEKEKNGDDLLDGYRLLSEVDSIMGNYSQSLKLYKKYIGLKDSIHNLNSKTFLKNLELSYETSKKEQQIAFLKTQNELANLQNNKQKKYLLAQLSILVLIVLLVWVLYNRYSTKQLALKEIKKKSDENKELAQEVQHRVKNNFQIIMSIINSQVLYFDDKEEIKSALLDNQSKIRSVSLVYDRLSDNLEADVVPSKRFFKELIGNISNAYDTSKIGVKFKMHLEDHPIDGNKAVPLGLAINELITTAVKRATLLGNTEKVIYMNFITIENDRYRLTIEDKGIGAFEALDLNEEKTYWLQMVLGLMGEIGATLEKDVDSNSRIAILF